jgi:ribose 5-phosphate isomerase B
MDQKFEKLALGSDHAGFKLKEEIIRYLVSNEIQFHDFGTYSDESTDYPIFAHAVAHAVNNGSFARGVVICGSGNGVNMTANKYPEVRAALCWNAEIARLARLHNDANILSLPGRFIESGEAIRALNAFLETDFEGGRHAARVKKISPNL